MSAGRFTEMERRTLLRIDLSYIRNKSQENVGGYYLRFDYEKDGTCYIGKITDEETATKLAQHIQDCILKQDWTDGTD